MVCHHIEENWGGSQAAKFYKEAVAPALKNQYPGHKVYFILEDNDPTGNYFGVGVKAKEDMKLKVLRIIKRSPDLNVLDYATWSEVERHMRKQEQRFPPSKTETREEFKRRLARTARNLSTTFINKSIGDMAVRCQKLYDAEGGLFEEGGKRKRRPL